jgi:thioredoxin reductase (NADPH)
MAGRPILLCVDDDPEVLRAIERDLRRKYGERYRILAADSGATGLETLRQIQLRGDAVALFVVDQRMPRMSGIEFLEQAITDFHDAKRVLLTAYADTEAAIQAINSVDLDHYLLKPWDPPELLLYPVLDDLLDEWEASYRPPFEGLRIVGHRWSAESHNLRDFLARNQIPFQWLDVETKDEAQKLMELAGADGSGLPLVLFSDGTHLHRPEHRQIAEQLGLRTHAELPFYDLLVIGAGPSGLAAAVYGASEGLKTALIEREAPGGQAGMSSRIENYLGFPAGLSGGDLARRAVAQARRFGAEILTPLEAASIRIGDPYKVVTLTDGSEINCTALLIATGVSYRRLTAEGVDELTGAGVYYGAAMTEAMSCQGQDVFVVGGANSAGQAAVYFSTYARNVTMLVRGPSLSDSMSQYLIDRIMETPNIHVRARCEVAAVHGDGHLEEITIEDRDTGQRETVPAFALFVFIGAEPCTEWLDGLVACDERGFILAGPDLPRTAKGKHVRGWSSDREPFLLESSVPGIFVAGDARHGSVKRVASGVGEGSIAVSFIHQYLASLGAGVGA